MNLSKELPNNEIELPNGWEIELADNFETTENKYYWIQSIYDQLLRKKEQTGNLKKTIISRIARTLQEIWMHHSIDLKGNIVYNTNILRSPISLDNFPPDMPPNILDLFLITKREAVAGKKRKQLSEEDKEKKLAYQQQRRKQKREEKEQDAEKSLEERIEDAQKRIEDAQKRIMDAKKERERLEAEKKRIKEEKKREREKQQMMRTFINDLFKKIIRSKNYAKLGFSAHPDDTVCNADNIYTYLLNLSTKSNDNPSDDIANYLKEYERNCQRRRKTSDSSIAGACWRH